MAFSEGPRGKVFSWEELTIGIGTQVHGGDFILSFCLAARTHLGSYLALLFRLTHPILMAGIWRGERGRTFGDTLRSLLFIWAGMATYGNLSFYRLDRMGWDERKDGWAFMGRGVSGHEALLQSRIGYGVMIVGNSSRPREVICLYLVVLESWLRKRSLAVPLWAYMSWVWLLGISGRSTQ